MPISLRALIALVFIHLCEIRFFFKFSIVCFTQNPNTDYKFNQDSLAKRSSFVSFNQNDPKALKQIGNASFKENK